MKKRPVLHVGLIVGIVFSVIIMILSIPLLFPNYDEGDRYTYNHFDFFRENGTWFTVAQEEDRLLRVALRNGPRELEDIPVRGNISEFRQSPSFIITFDPNESVHTSDVTMAMAETAISLAVHFGKNITPACTQDHPDCAGALKAVCGSADRPVIFLNNLGSPGIEIRGDCAIISGKGDDLVRAADRFMYGVYGIMK